MKQYYMVCLEKGYRLTGYYNNKKEALKQFRNSYGCLPDEIWRDDRLLTSR